MGDALVTSTYGRALYEAAGEAGRQKVLEEVTLLAELLEEEKMMRELLVSPAVTPEEKKAFAEHVLRGRICDEMVNFLFVLIDKERVWYLPRIARYYLRLYEEEQRVSSGKIYSAVPLSQEQVVSSAEAMSELLDRRVQLENEVDTSLIGGVKIQVDGKMIDRSLKGELALLLTGLKK